jgi:pfkB family carbohydrate kinase
MHRIAIAGHICVDIRPQLQATTHLDPGELVQVGPVAITLGGAVGNTCSDLNAMGAPVSVFTSIGDDELGRLVQTELTTDPLIAGDVRVVAGESTSYSLILEPAGVDRAIWHHVGSNAAFTGSGIDLVGFDLFHLGYPPLLPGLLVNGGEPPCQHSVSLGETPDGPQGSTDMPRLLKRGHCCVGYVFGTDEVCLLGRPVAESASGLGEVRVHGRGGDDAEPDALGTNFTRRRCRELDLRRFGRCVDRLVCPTSS